MFVSASRRRHARSLCDWSSGVCSSDLPTERGGSRSSPLSLLVRPCSRSLVALVFTKDARPIQRDCVKLNGEVALGKVGCGRVADEGERMAPLEVGYRNDVALESSHRVTRKVNRGGAIGVYQSCAVTRHHTATVEQLEYQFAAFRYNTGQRTRTCSSDRRRSRTGRRHSTEEEECHLALLRGRAEWVKRSVGDCDTRVESALIGHEREQQVASAAVDRERRAIRRGRAEARNRSVRIGRLDTGQRAARRS